MGWAEQATNRERKLLAALLDFNQQIGQSGVLPELLQQLTEVVCTLSHADTCWLMVRDADDDELRCCASTGLALSSAEKISDALLSLGVLEPVTNEGRGLSMRDLAEQEGLASLRSEINGVRAVCCVPMCGHDGLLGVVGAGSSDPNHFNAEDRQFLRYLATSVGRDIDNARLYRRATTDPLTGAFNRQYLCDRLPAEIERHRRYGQPLSLIIMDVDGFKRINDECGHQAGDLALQNLATRISSVKREVDSLVRYGGDEFLLILPCTGLGGARLVSARLREQIASRPVLANGKSVQMTVSGGAAELLMQDEDASALVARADALLYQAKAMGRDRVICAAS